MGPVELHGDGAAQELLKIPGAFQHPLQPCRADLEAVAAVDGVMFVQNGVHGPGNGLAVVNVHAALLVNVEPEEILRALPDVFHVPQL